MNIISQDIKVKNKKVNYNDYLKLKNAYLKLQENIKNLKEENTHLNSLLESYQEEIKKNEDYKMKINQSFVIIEKKYSDLFNENQEIKNYYVKNEAKNNELLEECNNYKLLIDELNNQVKQYQIELSNKNIEIEKLKNLNNHNETEAKELNKIKEQELKEKEEKIKNEENKLKKKEELLEQNDQALIQREQMIKNNEEKIKNKEELNKKLEEELKEKEKMLKIKEQKLNEEVKKNEELFKKRQNEIKKKEEEIINKNEEIKNEIEKIKENKKIMVENNSKILEKEILLNREIEKMEIKKSNILPKQEIVLVYFGNEKKNNVNNKFYELIIEQINSYQILKDESKNKNIKIYDKENKIDNKLNLINGAILDNYLNTINIGFNESEYINNEYLNDYNYECEPIPSFLLCMQKKAKK